IVHVEPAHAPTTTEAQYRDELVLRMGISAFNQRLSDKATGADVAYLNVRASSGDEANALHNTALDATAKPGKLKETLQEATLELQRARAFGFHLRELDDVKKELLSGAQRAVETESTQPMSAFISRLNNAVASGDTLLSPQQRLELLKKHLASITAEMVN